MAKRIIRLNENEFKKILTESIMMLKEQEIGLDNLPENDYDDYDGIGDELSQEDRWADYDKATMENEIDMLNDHPNLYDNVPGYEEYDGWHDDEDYYDDEDDYAGIEDELISEAIRKSLNRNLK